MQVASDIVSSYICEDSVVVDMEVHLSVDQLLFVQRKIPSKGVSKGFVQSEDHQRNLPEQESCDSGQEFDLR